MEGGKIILMPLAEPSRQVVLDQTQGLNPELQADFQTLVDRLAQEGYAISVMASNGQPSDHKVWWNGSAWTFRSSNNYQAGTFRWDPYQQVPPVVPFNACGIPISAGQDCPSWFKGTGIPPAGPIAGPPAGSTAPGEAIGSLSDADIAKLTQSVSQAILGALPGILGKFATENPLAFPSYSTSAFGIPIVLHPDHPKEAL